MPRRSRLFSALLSLLWLVAPATSSAGPLPVVVSIPPQKYLLERIAGDAVTVTVLLKPGADPHTYEPSPAQMRTAAAAAAWFTIGVPFEEVWLPRIGGVAGNLTVYSSIRGIRRLPFQDREAPEEELARTPHTADKGPDTAVSGPRHTPKAGAGSGHAPGHAHGPDHGHGHGEDPHVWLSPPLVREMVRGMAGDLGALLPEKAAGFHERAEAFAGELDALDRELAAGFQTVPVEKRVFLTVHPSWRYFADHYGLIELSIEMEGKEPGPRGLETVTDLAGRAGIRTVFVEPQFPKNTAGAVAEAIGAEVVVADPLEEDLLNLFRTMADKLMAAFNG